jgi:hypothetical protein
LCSREKRGRRLELEKLRGFKERSRNNDGRRRRNIRGRRHG